MSQKKSNLTAPAVAGYAAANDAAVTENPYLQTSPNWFAFELGKYFKRTGRSEPRDVRMGRGYQIHSNNMLFAFDARYAITRVS